jgi:hypothetical protein
MTLDQIVLELDNITGSYARYFDNLGKWDGVHYYDWRAIEIAEALIWELRRLHSRVRDARMQEVLSDTREK